MQNLALSLLLTLSPAQDATGSIGPNITTDAETASGGRKEIRISGGRKEIRISGGRKEIRI